MKALAKLWKKGWRPVTALALVLFSTSALAFPNGQTPFAGSSFPQFVDPLPRLNVQPGGTMNTIVATNTSFAQPLELHMCEFKTRILPSTWVPPVGSTYAGFTWTWGYFPNGCPAADAVQDTYIGPVLVNQRGIPTTIRFTNALPLVNATNVLAYKFSTDQTLHWADPLGANPGAPLTPYPSETNMCHMDSGNPPAMNVGIQPFGSLCSLNFGEYPRGTFNPVGIPAVPHLHGGEVPPVIDGGPDAWFTSDGKLKGHDYYTNPNVPAAANQAVYSYPNSQGAAPIWFHDHTLGATRLNVYAGIAGGYYIVDPAQESYFTSINMLPITEVIPLVLQDRQFDTNGQLYFPVDFPGGLNGPATNPQHPYWIPEFIGDVIVINGKAWPYLNVEPRRYRFLFLNGSNARTYEMFFVNSMTKVMGPSIWAIGNDAGVLDFPAIIDPNAATPAQNHLIMQPGERYEVIVDFTNFANQTLIIKNVAKAPYPSGKSPKGTTTGQLMQFRVGAKSTYPNPIYDPASGVALRAADNRIVRMATNGVSNVTPAKTRELTLNEAHLLTQTATDPVTGVANTIYPGGPVEILVNNSLWSGESTRPYGDFQPVTINGVTELISETPSEGTIELWEIVNTTMDAHPIHTHLASFQILNRQNYNAKAFTAAYNAGFTSNLTPGCAMGIACPGYGPPYHYDPAKNPLSAGKWGGNPDVTPYLQGSIRLPDPNESGWKDTFITYPGMVNRFLVRWGPQETALGNVAGYPFSPNDGTNGSVNDSHGYVWHCHIIDHEDNEMMRQDVIVPLDLPNCSATITTNCRSYVKGTHY
jgi:FtsP/CotA-like multicopper oxidase with cupredoxin domain